MSYLLSAVVFCISKEASFQIILIHLRIVSHKRNILKQCRPRSDATGRRFCSGSTLFTLSTRIYMKHGINKKKTKTDTPSIGNGPVQRLDVEKSIGHKWVKQFSSATKWAASSETRKFRRFRSSCACAFGRLYPMIL